MKRLILFVLLAALQCADGFAQGVQYSLHAVPAVPVAGQGFAAVFVDTECEEFILMPPAAAPSVTVQGNVVTVAVDRIDVLDCSSPAATYSIPVPGLPAGNYTLELLARAMGEPGNQIVEASVQFAVVSGAAAGTFAVPTTSWTALTSLCAFVILGMFAYAHRR